MAIVVKVGGTTLPDGLVELKRGDELLWSEGTGRSASSGQMVGSVVAQKQTYTLRWGVITATQYAAIRSAIGSGYLSLLITVNSSTFANITVYRGTISGDLLGTFGGTAYWKDVTVELVER
jgi:hypothetical protein